jgi:hypothetical protein
LTEVGLTEVGLTGVDLPLLDIDRAKFPLQKSSAMCHFSQVTNIAFYDYTFSDTSSPDTLGFLRT